MKKYSAFVALCCIFITATAQQKSSKRLLGIGIKGGLNFANITKAKDIGRSSKTGFIAGAFFSPASKKIISPRTELLFSRQGYHFKTNTSTGAVDLNYLILPQLMGINITRFVQLQIGGQMPYLLNATADSTGTSSSITEPICKNDGLLQ